MFSFLSCILLCLLLANLLRARVVLKAMDEFWALDQEIGDEGAVDHDAGLALDGAGDRL